MNELKASLLPGLLAYVGVRAASMFAPSSTPWQLAGGIGGAIFGVFISKKI